MSDQPPTNPPAPAAYTPPAPIAASVPVPQAAQPPAEAAHGTTAEIVGAGERCRNCDAVLSGEYCAHCGQNAKHHVHSTIAMVGELIEDLFHTDHRVWRTIRPLLFTPGFLTVEYLRGKRASYTPPFRLYIVLSLIFFFSASVTKEEANVAIAPPSETQRGAVTYEIDPDVQERFEEFLTRLDSGEREQVRTRMEAELHKMKPADQKLSVDAMFNPCSPSALGSALPETFEYRGTLLDVCRRLTRNQGKDFGEELKHYIPQMMFFFLPLIALWAKVLYIGSKRYYAEHFLFFVHFHAAFFLVMAAYNVLGWILGWFKAGWADMVSGLLTAFVVFYLPIYLYLAMRRMYRQGGFVTSFKYMMLSCGYVANAFLSFAVFAAYTAMMLK